MIFLKLPQRKCLKNIALDFSQEKSLNRFSAYFDSRSPINAAFEKMSNNWTELRSLERISLRLDGFTEEKSRKFY